MIGIIPFRAKMKMAVPMYIPLSPYIINSSLYYPYHRQSELAKVHITGI